MPKAQRTMVLLSSPTFSCVLDHGHIHGKYAVQASQRTHDSGMPLFVFSMGKSTEKTAFVPSFDGPFELTFQEPLLGRGIDLPADEPVFDDFRIHAVGAEDLELLDYCDRSQRLEDVLDLLALPVQHGVRQAFSMVCWR